MIQRGDVHGAGDDRRYVHGFEIMPQHGECTKLYNGTSTSFEEVLRGQHGWF